MVRRGERLAVAVAVIVIVLELMIAPASSVGLIDRETIALINLCNAMNATTKQDYITRLGAAFIGWRTCDLANTSLACSDNWTGVICDGPAYDRVNELYFFQIP